MSSREEVPDKKQKCEGENKVIEVLIRRYQFVFGIRSLYRLLPVKSQELLPTRMLIA